MALEFLKQLFRIPSSSARSLQGKSILVIDDGEVERKIYSNALQSVGCQVRTCIDGTTGLTTAVSESFDLILLDYMLPDTNGIEVCRKLKADVRTRDIPVIFLTGSMKPEGVITCYDAGADCYLTKPISSVTLIQQVRSALL